MRYLAIVLALSCAPLAAQTNGGIGSALPGTCIIGTVFMSTANLPMSVCTATNTWTTLPGVKALAHANPADQTGNGTATLKMNGLGAAAAPCSITPTSSGKVVFTVTGDVTNSTILDGAAILLAYGTGAAPANAGAAAGTLISATRGPAVAVAAQKQGFALTASATGLTVNTAYWYDLQIANVTGGTASVSNVDCTAFEVDLDLFGDVLA